MSKTTKKTLAPAPATPAKGPGVIAALVDLLTDGKGYTTTELYEKLVERFPDRASPKGGMRVTVSVQLKALHKKGRIVVTSQDIEGRGRVYSATLPKGA